MANRTKRFQAIGTKWQLVIESEASDAEWELLQAAIRLRVREFDKNYSRFRSDSWVSKIAKEAGQYPMPPDAYPLLKFYAELYTATGGLVTPVVGQLLSDAGYDASYSFKQQALSTPPKFDEVVSFTENEIHLKQPVLLDVGAAGKGYLVDIIGRLLEETGVQEFVINAGGDILHHGKSPIMVGLENPKDTSEAVGVATLQNGSLCASAGSRRAWGKYHHIINPASLESPKDVLATWVIAGDAMTADGLATALFFAPIQELQSSFQFSGAVLDNEMGMTRSKDFPITIFEVTNALD